MQEEVDEWDPSESCTNATKTRLKAVAKASSCRRSDSGKAAAAGRRTGTVSDYGSGSYSDAEATSGQYSSSSESDYDEYAALGGHCMGLLSHSQATLSGTGWSHARVLHGPEACAAVCLSKQKVEQGQGFVG